jgi:hypothetical protein
VLTEHIYPDGGFRVDTAYYCIFPDEKVNEIVVKAESIEVQLNKKWLSVNAFLST